MKTPIDLARFGIGKASLVRHALSGETMGTRYSALLYAEPGTNLGKLNTSLQDAVDRVDQQMSTWKRDSDLNRLNDAPIGSWVDVPSQLMEVLGTVLEIGRTSNGAFDIAVGELVSAWGFGPPSDQTAGFRPSSVPSISALDALGLDQARGRACRSAHFRLDLSGIAKGYGVDEMARVMNSFGISAWLVGIDGEMRARGTKPDGSLWAVAHERPDRHIREAMGVIELQDMAVATSGNYRHGRDVGGKWVSHTMNPRTNAPLENAVASVTVLAPTCMAADAWTTAFMIAGPELGLDQARAMKMDVIFVLDDGSVHSTL